jgi:signal peptidase II
MILYNKKMILPYVIIIFFITIDRFIKYLANNDYFNDGINLIGDFFKLNFARNYNIAFSLPFNGLFLNIIIILIILGLVYNLIYVALKGRYHQTVLLSVIILGAMSNLLDRLKHGYVIDYFDLKYFTVFNLADVMIVGGVVGLGWIILIDEKRNIV